MKRTGSKRTKQLSLPTANVRHLLDVADQICPGLGGKLTAKANKFDSSERIVVSERVYTVVRDEKQVYGCGDGTPLRDRAGPCSSRPRRSI